MVKAEQSHNLHGIKVARHSSLVSHLLHADDILLFSRANKKELKYLNSILDMYCKWMAQIVNTQMSNLIFSPNMSIDLKRELLNILQV